MFNVEYTIFGENFMMDLLHHIGEFGRIDFLVAAGILAAGIAVFIIGFAPGRRRDYSVGNGIIALMVYAYCVAAAVFWGQRLLYEAVGVSSVEDMKVCFYLVAGIGGLCGIAASRVAAGTDSVLAIVAVCILTPLLEVVLGVLVILALGIAGGVFKDSWVAMICCLSVFAFAGGSVIVVIIGD